MNKHFTSHGTEYVMDRVGAIHQVDPKAFTYDANYVATYDTPEYQRGNDYLQALRWGFVLASHGYQPKTLVDVGYGNGAFLKAGQGLELKLHGLDVTGVPLPEGITSLTEYVPADIYTFNDCLEHIADLNFLRDLPTKTIVISLPFCHMRSQGQQWFDHKYKHRKPDEHVHHFDRQALIDTMFLFGYRCVSSGTHEDAIRKSTHGLPNIITMGFKKLYRFK